MTIRVVIADDQQLVRTGFRMILESEADIEVVGEASDGRQAVSVARQAHPDVVLMDIRMPELDGIEATRQLTSASQHPPIRVLILTTFDLDEYVFDALRLVATGMSNAEIAAALIIGETTVKTHVTRLLMKLGLRDRVQAVVLAYDTGIASPGSKRKYVG